MVASLALPSGCLLVGYDARPTERALDGGNWEDADPDSGARDAPAADHPPDGASAADASGPSIAPNDAASDEPVQDGEPGPDAGTDARDDDGGSTGAEGEAGLDADIGCTTTNACGGCGELAATVGARCGQCGVGRYACANASAVVCSGDGLPTASGGALLIDDFEDGDQFINATAGLSGSWYTTSDGTPGFLDPPAGTDLVPASVGAAGSTRSGHVLGGGFTDWGAALAVSLNAYGCSYDASQESGLAFYAKGSGSVTLSIATRQTVPISEGGTCQTDCYDNFALTLLLGSNWTSYAFPWSALHQSGWGAPAALVPGQLKYVQFGFAANSYFELYVDNMSFY